SPAHKSRPVERSAQAVGGTAGTGDLPYNERSVTTRDGDAEGVSLRSGPLELQTVPPDEQTGLLQVRARPRYRLQARSRTRLSVVVGDRDTAPRLAAVSPRARQPPSTPTAMSRMRHTSGIVASAGATPSSTNRTDRISPTKAPRSMSIGCQVSDDPTT